MKVDELVQFFYYNVPYSEYEIKADEYQSFFDEKGISKEYFLKKLSMYVPDKGFEHVRDYLKKEYSFKRISKELEKAYKESGFFSDFSFLDCISCVFYELLRVVSYKEKRPCFSIEDYRRVLDMMKSEEFMDSFKGVYIRQKAPKARVRTEEQDLFQFNAFIYAHFLQTWFDGNRDFSKEYESFLEKYDEIDDRDKHLPFVNEIERQRIRRVQDLINVDEFEDYEEEINDLFSDPEFINERISKITIEELKKDYLKTGKSKSDFEETVSVAKAIFENNALLQTRLDGMAVYEQEYIIEAIEKEIWYQEHKQDRNESMLDRFINRENIDDDLDAIREVLSEDRMKEYFSKEEYGVSFIKELALSLFKLFDLESWDVADMVKQDEDCKRSYQFLKDKSDHMFLRIFHSAYDDYVSDLFGALLLNLDKRKIRRWMLNCLRDAEVSFPDCFRRGLYEIAIYKDGAIPDSELYVRESAGVYLISYLKDPAASFGIMEFANYFISRYRSCIIADFNEREVNGEEVREIILDFMKKWENNKGSFDQAQENLIDAYAVYEAAAKAFDLNDRFLWPENPLSAFSGDDAWFMHDFTYHYFSKYIGKDNTIRKFRFKDYFKVYVQALNYKNMIDHILDDEELVPDFDLSFEDEFSELIRKENEEINDEKSEDLEQLHKQITDLTENRNEWKKEAQLLHEERNELRKDLEKINQRNEETEEENDLLKQENIALQKISYRYDELMAEKTKADPEEIHSLLSSRKIGISGMNKTMGLRFKEKYPDIVWYETAGDVNSGAGLLDYIFIMTQYNSHKITTLINKQVGSSKTRIINIGEVKSNFELAQKVIYAKIKEEEK